MELTYEQQTILRSDGNIKINAVAGSGKTTTLIEYARTRPPGSRILYLAFNKSVRMEATDKFRAYGLWNVTRETAHSLAYKHIVRKYGYKLRASEYSTYEIAELLQLREQNEKYLRYVIAGHIGKFFTCYCNSNKSSFSETGYPGLTEKTHPGNSPASLYGYIEKKASLLWEKMESGEIEVTHNFYLKKFQLAQPALPYDYILFDEGQDASPAMLDVFLRQKATKIIVGDVNQQIYSWRYAVNSLQQVNFPAFTLTHSFRFGREIACLANSILAWKKHLGTYIPGLIVGKGETDSHCRKAILARTNLGLLTKAIEYATEKRHIRHIYFEGNINSYAYADEGASLYDILYLYNNCPQKIRDPLIKEMRSLKELEAYILHTGEFQTAMLVEVVKKYGNRIPAIMRAIKNKHVENKQEAEIIFSTVHRCKGMEYDAIQLVNDFLAENKLLELRNNYENKKQIKTLTEEINLLYVAVTRTRNSIHIPQTLLPSGISPSEHIYIVRNTTQPDIPQPVVAEPPATPALHSSLAYSDTLFRTKAQNAYSRWTADEEKELVKMRNIGVSIKDMSLHFGRSQGFIRARIKKLNLE